MWGIISAKYGLLHPDALVKPYNVTVPPKGTLECLNLATRISIQLVNRFGHPGSLVFWPKDITTVVLAGKRYVELMPYYVNAQDPLSGLGIGQRLAWLNERIGGGLVR